MSERERVYLTLLVAGEHADAMVVAFAPADLRMDAADPPHTPAECALWTARRRAWIRILEGGMAP